MDVFHLRSTESGTRSKDENLETSYNEIYRWTDREKADLFRDVTEAYDQEVLQHRSLDEGVSEVINLYRLSRREEGVIYVGEEREAVRTEELQELRRIVDRHLGGDQK